MFLRWNSGCNSPIIQCNVFEEYDTLPVGQGDVWILPNLPPNISLINATTGVNLGVISSNYVPASLSFFDFSVTNINSNSVVKFATSFNCTPNCLAPIERSSYATDFDFLEAFAIQIATTLSATYSIDSSKNIIRIFFSPSLSDYCGAVLTVNPGFSTEDGACSKPNINSGCVLPSVVTERAGLCSPENKCLPMIQVQGANVCLTAVTQPVCATGARTQLGFPLGMNPNHCYYLQYTDRGVDYCSQQIKVSCGDCFNSLIRARNKTENLYQVRLPFYLHSKQFAGGGENSKSGTNSIRRLYSTKETVYTLTTDYLFNDVHFSLAELLQKDIVEIFGIYEPLGTARWENFVLLDSYEIKYQDSQPRRHLAQGEAKLTLNKYSYTNFNC